MVGSHQTLSARGTKNTNAANFSHDNICLFNEFKYGIFLTLWYPKILYVEYYELNKGLKQNWSVHVKSAILVNECVRY